jgi:hypothetical protein
MGGVGWLVGLLVGWLVGLLVGWLVGLLVGLLFGWLVGLLVGLLLAGVGTTLLLGLAACCTFGAHSTGRTVLPVESKERRNVHRGMNMILGLECYYFTTTKKRNAGTKHKQSAVALFGKI